MLEFLNFKSIRPEVFCKGVLENFTRFTEKHLCQGLIFNKAAGLRPVTLLKKRPATLLKRDCVWILRNF